MFTRQLFNNKSFIRQLSTYPKSCYLSESNVRERVLHVVSNIKSAPEVISNEAHFVADLKFDSLRRQDLRQNLEKEFCVHIPANTDLLSVKQATEYFTSNPKSR